MEMRDVINAGALELIEATVAAGCDPASARKWWMGEISRRAKEREVSLDEAGVSPAQVAELQGLIDAGRINDKLARQALEGVLAGEGDPTQVVEARGLEVVSDDGALTAGRPGGPGRPPRHRRQDQGRQGQAVAPCPAPS